MNRCIFEEEFKLASSKVNNAKKLAVCMHSFKPLNDSDKTIKLVIAMEELSELQQELIGAMVGKPNRMGLLEEITDVTLVLDWIEILCNLEDEEILEAISYRSEQFSNSKGITVLTIVKNLAELQQEISKVIREKGRRLALIFRIADVSLSLDWLKTKSEFTDEEINKALNVKIDRLYDKIFPQNDN